MISGTPGTGKTQVSGLLAKKLGFKLIAVNDFAEGHGLVEDTDEVRGSLVIDEEKLKTEIDKLSGDMVVDGHLAHFCSADLVVVLRTSPIVLEKRLLSRDWSPGKITENVEAEILDVILQEAVEVNGNVVEIDTTALDAKAVAGVISDMVKNKNYGDYRPGKVSWATFFDMLSL
ncbi:MAG: adenylate kinase family protein [Candidatus Aenigmarchaeota archaeon]|nr:adenylate kinase family protein [Candidatus Aenigmarchaeota archaeon]